MTDLYLTSAAADAAVTAGSGTKWKCATAPGASATHLNKNSVAGPTVPLQMTDGAAGVDGNLVSWYTDPLEAVTIAGAIACTFWDRENATANNIGPTIRIERCDGAGNVLSVIVSETTNHSATEMGTTAGGTADNISPTAANVTDTTISAGDRLRITLWIDDAAGQGGVGSMAAGGYGEFWVNGPQGSQGQSRITFTEAVGPPVAGPTVTAFEASWSATTTPKTISVTGAVTGDIIAVFSGGDNGTGGSNVSAVVTTNTGGSTSAGAGAWSEPQEGLATSSQAWTSLAAATVTADGTVTVSVARTQSTGLLWGCFALLIHNHGGLGNSVRVAPSATETGSLGVSQDSLVGALAVDWDALAVVAFSPAGAVEVERSQQGAGPDLTYYAGYWRGQAAGTRGYGIGTSSTTNLHIIALEIKAAPTGGGAALPTSQLKNRIPTQRAMAASGANFAR